MKSSETIGEIAKALSSFQGSVNAAKNDKKNPFFKSTYANLASIWSSIRQYLSENGLCVVQDALTLPEGVSVVTRVMHSSGEYIEFGPLIIPMGKKDAHSTGSAITYAKRYGLSAALGIVSDDEDDDGNRAQKSAPIAPKKEPPHVDVDEWYENMTNSYPDIDLISYVKNASERMKCNEQKTINYLATLDSNKLKTSLERWKKQN